MATSLHLLPTPKSLVMTRGAFRLPADLFIVLQNHAATRELFAPESFALDAEPLTRAGIHIAHGDGVDAAAEIRVRFDDSIAPDAPATVRDQAYRLSITPAGITLAARSAAGTFYGFQTLLQIVREAAFALLSGPRAARASKGKKKAPERALELPCVTIEDFPDFPRRGFYHDTARGKVPTVDTLLQLIDDLGHLKYNEFQLYIENNFEFRKFPEMYEDTSPFTAEEISLLDAACRARHIDFVPSLTSLGHFEKILGRPKFRHLAEAEPAELKAKNLTCWSDTPWSLCVTDAAAKELLKDMYAEFVPNFSSGQFNICCDESYDLGTIRSKEAADKVGTGQLYVDWIRYCAELAGSEVAGGKSIQMWGDIILNHPDLLGQLPENATLLEWGYEHDHKFDEHCALFAERLKGGGGGGESQAKGKRSFYVCPGTSTWLTLAARSQNAFANIHNAASAGLKHGARGLLLTDWGDIGHQQMLAVSLSPLAYAAAASWNLKATPSPGHPAQDAKKAKPGAVGADLKDILRAISLHFFQDPTGQFAALTYDLGLTYLRFSWQRFNASLEWYLFREHFDFANYVNRADPKDLPKVAGAIEKLIAQFADAPLLHPDADLIKHELIFTCEEILHACRRTEIRQQWLAADPAKRNPEEPTLRGKAPRALPRSFKRDMADLHATIRRLEKNFRSLWLARNKKSRMEDVVHEFNRVAGEYRRFAKP